jgi:hypothetical protein
VRTALVAAETDPTGATAAPPLPHDPDGGEAWEAWLSEPDDEGGVSRYLRALWVESIELQRRHPDVTGADRAAFLRWGAGPDADGAEIPERFRPTPEEVAVPGSDGSTRPRRRPPRPGAEAQTPVEAIDRARAALTAADDDRGAVGDVLERLRGDRGRRSDEVATALLEAVEVLADRLADLSDRVDRTNDGLYEQALRGDELAEADTALATEAEALGRRLVEVEAATSDARAELVGAHEQDRITAAILADAETRLAAELDDVRLRLAKLALGDTPAGPDTPAAPDAPAAPPTPTHPRAQEDTDVPHHPDEADA